MAEWYIHLKKASAITYYWTCSGQLLQRYTHADADIPWRRPIGASPFELSGLDASMNSTLIMSATADFFPAEKETHDQTHFLLRPQAERRTTKSAGKDTGINRLPPCLFLNGFSSLHKMSRLTMASATSMWNSSERLWYQRIVPWYKPIIKFCSAYINPAQMHDRSSNLQQSHHSPSA